MIYNLRILLIICPVKKPGFVPKYLMRKKFINKLAIRHNFHVLV
jgi:hypothetical protein